MAVLYVTNGNIGVHNIYGYMKAQWPSITPTRIMVHKEGHFLIQLKSTVDHEEIFPNEPYI